MRSKPSRWHGRAIMILGCVLFPSGCTGGVYSMHVQPKQEAPAAIQQGLLLPGMKGCGYIITTAEKGGAPKRI